MNENSLNSITSESVEKPEEIMIQHKEQILDLQQKIESLKQIIFNITHDTKGPLSAVNTLLGFAMDELKSGEFNKEDFMNQLEEAMNAILNVISINEDVLLSYKIELNKIKPDLMIMDLKDSLDKQISCLSSVANLKKIKIFNEVSEDLKVITDFNILDSILKNLISNSIKFTNKDGEILISSKNEGSFVLILIKDNGVGIKEEITKDLFNKSGTTSLGTFGEKGTGLGLQNCQKLIEKIGGSIELKSDGYNKGTTAIIRLPAIKE